MVSSYLTYYQQVYKKRASLEMNAMEMNTALDDILLKGRLGLIAGGLPADSPLVTLPLQKFHADLLHDHGHKKDPVAQTKLFIDTMKADNFALFDSIMLPQAKSLVAAGISPNHPIITGPRDRLASRKRSGHFLVFDPEAIKGSSLSRDAFTLPPVA